MSWRDLAPYLTAINEATRLNLIVFVSACYGLDLATLFQPLKPAPARVVVGPMREIDVPEIDKAIPVFYRALFRDLKGVTALKAMNEALSPGSEPFHVLTAEDMLLRVLVSYFNEATNDTQVAARAEGIIAQQILNGMPPAIAVARREQLRARLGDRKAIFDAAYRAFFFVDKHPEIANRFVMTYELCFQEARSTE